MVNIGAAKLAVVMTIGIVSIGSTNLAFAQQTPCGEQAYVYNVGCMPLDTAHLAGGVIVASIVVFAIACGVAGSKNHTIPSFK